MAEKSEDSVESADYITPWGHRIDTKIAAAVIAIASMLVIGTVAFHLLEKWTWVQSFYFSVITLTTVGYGDIYPTTDLSRIFTALYILSGVAIVLASLEIIGATYLANREREMLMRKDADKGENPALKAKSELNRFGLIFRRRSKQESGKRAKTY
jgi:voltage-gated potassium channel Kch